MLFPSLFHAASVSVILSQSQHFTNLWHNDKYWFSLQRDSMRKTILFKLIYNFSKTINYYIYHLQDANCVLGYFSTVSHSMHQNWYKTWQINFWPFLFGFYIFLSFFLHWLDKRHMVGQRVWIIDKLASRCMYVQIDARQSLSGSSQYNLVCLYIIGETEQIQ